MSDEETAPAAGGPSVPDDSGDTSLALKELRHELRTPLNQIIGYSEMLAEDAQESGRSELHSDLLKIHRAAHHLLDVINRELIPGGGVSGRLAASQAVPLPDTPPTLSVDAPAVRLSGRVLVVDDDEVNRDVLGRRLERHGCTVVDAEDGAQALALIQAQPFDLVFLDVMMPGLDGEAVLHRIKAHPASRDLPVIMISALDDIDRVARCIEGGAEDYLPKPFNPTLLRARVGACLERKALRDQERKTHQALLDSQRRLAIELADAADYVESLLPAPLAGAVSATSRFIPSTSLGGDAFGYHWIDEDHFAIYLLDVCGHGVATALLSVSAVNVLRSHSLPGTDFRQPGQVLSGLNRAFPMEKQNNLYFTAWYGVYQRSTRRLAYSSGGHPPAALVRPPAIDSGGGRGSAGVDPSPQLPAVTLSTPGTMVGWLPDVPYSTESCDVPPGSRLFVFSDGVYEIERLEGEMWTLEELFEYVAQPSDPVQGDLDRLVSFARNLHGRPDLDDDFSIIRIVFE